MDGINIMCVCVCGRVYLVHMENTYDWVFLRRRYVPVRDRSVRYTDITMSMGMLAFDCGWGRVFVRYVLVFFLAEVD